MALSSISQPPPPSPPSQHYLPLPFGFPSPPPSSAPPYSSAPVLFQRPLAPVSSFFLNTPSLLSTGPFPASLGSRLLPTHRHQFSLAPGAPRHRSIKQGPNVGPSFSSIGALLDRMEALRSPSVRPLFDQTVGLCSAWPIRRNRMAFVLSDLCLALFGRIVREKLVPRKKVLDRYQKVGRR